MERHDIKLDLIKANIIAKKRKEDMAILLVDTSAMTITSRLGVRRSAPRS
jgi:hypothetical protein